MVERIGGGAVARPHPMPLPATGGGPLVMAILNATPDSFYDGGRFHGVSGPRLDRVVDYAARCMAAGADLLDVGGESTRPGAVPVAVDQELERVIPVIEALARRFPLPLSVDTSSPKVMCAAAGAGASLINDVRALRRPGAVAAAIAVDLPVCLMHMRGEPATMQADPQYQDVVAEVRDFLAERVQVCVAAGLARDRLLVDPGFGFGKTLAHNLALLRNLGEISSPGMPVMVGLSRKRMIGELTGRPVAQRRAGSVALAMVAALRGAAILRVHDVAPTVDALRIFTAVGDLPPRKRVERA